MTVQGKTAVSSTTTTDNETVKSPQDKKPCMCGSTEHRRISHLTCPLNPRKGESRKYDKRPRLDESGKRIDDDNVTDNSDDLVAHRLFTINQTIQETRDLDNEVVEDMGHDDKVGISNHLTFNTSHLNNVPIVNEVRSLIITTYLNPETTEEKRDKLSHVMQNICKNNEFHHGVINDCNNLGMNVKETLELMMDMCTRQIN